MQIAWSLCGTPRPDWASRATGFPRRNISISRTIITVLSRWQSPLAAAITLPAMAIPSAWARRYGADQKMVGRQIIINSHLYQVVGVLPRTFTLPREVLPTLEGTDQSDVLIPMRFASNPAEERGHEDYNIVGKLRPGVSLEQVRAEMDTITARLRQAHPEVYPPNGKLTFIVLPLLEQVVGNVRHTLWLLLAAVGCVLLIACANVANLMLSRALAQIGRAHV